MLACFVQYRPKLLRVFPSLAFSERAENSHLLIKMRLGWMIQQNNLTSGGAVDSFPAGHCSGTDGTSF